MYLHFWLMMYSLFCFGIIHDRGRYIDCICFLFLVSHCLLIYIYELFMIYCLYFVLCEIKKLLCFTSIFHTCVYAFVECFRNI